MNRRTIYIDESPIRFEKWRKYLPNWLKRFLPSRGGRAEDHHGKAIFGFTVFLLSESIVFLSFIFTYVGLRLTHSGNWLPPGVSGPELSTLVIINTVVLLSSSFVIQPAENALQRGRLKKFRWLWLMTIVMGTYFLIGQGIEWSKLDFGLSTGLVGSTFYVLTGFHGLHVFAGVILQITMLVRSFIPGNYDKGHFGVSATTLFWHFVDIIWVFLFSLLYLWQA
ncbi:heme-copper oxidase subunit III [Pelatocladus sp. BLCC-F211]|uniref:cytochrome c oxidase subunit 3 n=1 Tax=Pelatocladus sp. BLCC-F211 TaxID=3342752 RepID=UPI0035BB9CDE